MNDQVAEHEARRQRRAAAKKSEQKAESANLTIDGIRKLPDVQQQALDLMNKLQNMIPSLAADPTAGGNIPTAVQAAVNSPTWQQAPRQPGTRYVFVASLGKAVPVVETSADIPSLNIGRQSSPDTDSDDECSEDEDCELLPETGKRFVWRRNADGSKFFVQMAAKRSAPPDPVWKYILDKHTGRYERRQVPAAAHSVKSQRDLSKDKGKKDFLSPQYFDHRVQHPGTVGMGGRSGRLHREERQPSYVCPDSLSEKKGKESKIPELVHYARE